MPKRKVLPKTEDHLLPRSLTEEFISDLSQVLNDDTSPKALYQRRYWLQKFCNPTIKDASERRSKAITKWLATERLNRFTNNRIRHISSWSSPLKYRFDRVLSIARVFVHDILGDSPSLDLLYGGFSGGATTSKRRQEGHPALKFLDEADATRPSYLLFREVIRGTRWDDHWNESRLEPRFVPGNVLFTVPKNADIDRVACKEPDLNIFLQKCFGNQIRWLLRRRGVNLNDQSINGELARISSLDGRLATLDLSSASDSVSYELVKGILPFNWFCYLDACRSPSTSVDGVLHKNQMFSSMGNGYTFELESLIFYALARATAYLEGIRGTISVYGDDIIVPVELTESLVAVLSFFGFSVNQSKSFSKGPFRESCGAYWHKGVDVKPFFLRAPLSRTSDLILLLNSLTRWSHISGVHDPRYEAIIVKYSKFIPSCLFGGQDLTSRYSLVTGHRPRKELKPVTIMRKYSHVGGLLFWLFTAYARLGFVDEPLVAVGASQTGLSRLRKNRQTVDTSLPTLTTCVA